ncbi:MAG: hypothetical protein IRY91_12320 [Gemmatimonadaceae bacterium]|nr:hypothetical protein [Gemmatimonadaceae bacterium]
MKILYAALALALAGSASPAAAQFTAAVVPPKRVVRVDSTVRRDSVKRAQAERADRLSDMKTWVDSAARALAVAPPARDTGAAAGQEPVTQTAAGEVEPSSAGDTVFRNGGRAPATATSLPLFALIGAGVLLTGVALLRRS